MELTIEFETKQEFHIYTSCGNLLNTGIVSQILTDFRFGFGKKTRMFSLAKRANRICSYAFRGSRQYGFGMDRKKSIFQFFDYKQ